jgi:hypothetical protein
MKMGYLKVLVITITTRKKVYGNFMAQTANSPEVVLISMGK